MPDLVTVRDAETYSKAIASHSAESLNFVSASKTTVKEFAVTTDENGVPGEPVEVKTDDALPNNHAPSSEGIDGGLREA